MQAFDQAHQAIHYPPDRRFRVWVNHRFVLAFAVAVFTPVAIAWVQYLSFGLPTETFLPTINFANPPNPHGFPAWLRLNHFVNFFFLLLLVRSGLSILMDHSRLYWNCVPLPQVYGAPLRLRVENQLGYKMVKWIERIEFVETEKTLGKGEGGKTRTMNTLISCRTFEGPMARAI